MLQLRHKVGLIAPETKSYVLLHFSVILWSLTAILGDLISLSATTLVWWRVCITSVLMIFLPRVFSTIMKISPAILYRFLGIGAIVGFHWICFYGAIKMANASVALICMSTTTLFTAFIEPWVSRKSLSRIDIVFGILVIPGIFLTTQGLTSGMMIGFWVGIMSALLAAIFAVYNKRYIHESTPQVITTLEMLGAWIFLSVVIVAFQSRGDMGGFWPVPLDWIYLFVLAILCTIVPYILHLRAYEHLTAFASNLVVNLEPVYGILLAVLILHDHKELTPTFYAGVVLIFVVVIAYPYVKKRMRHKSSI